MTILDRVLGVKHMIDNMVKIMRRWFEHVEIRHQGQLRLTLH